jgi:hypothetical protein
VEGEVARYPSPNTDASWKVQVRELGPERQRIQLELFGDGIRGTVYEATARGILPLHTRLTGPGFAFAVAEIHFALWSVPWLLVYLAIRIWRRRARVRVKVDVA